MKNSTPITTYAELIALPGFEQGKTITHDTFVEVLTDYEIRDTELQCCLTDERGRCGQKHMHGYVIALSDNTLSIMGKDCAQKKFHAHENIILNINQFRKARDCQIELDRAWEFVENYDIYNQKLNEMVEDLKQINSFQFNVQYSLGRGNIENLMKRYKTQSQNINIKSYKFGKNDEEIYQATHTIGRIQQLSLFDGTDRSKYLFKISKMHEALRNAVKLKNRLMRGEELKQADIKERVSIIMSQLKNLNSFYMEIKRTINDIEAFWKTDFTPMCFLTDSYENSIEMIKCISSDLIVHSS